MLNDDSRKRLLRFIGKCPCVYEGDLEHCEYLCKPLEETTFTTWADLGAVKEALERAGKWDEFSLFALIYWWNNGDGSDWPTPSPKDIRKNFIPWLVRPAGSGAAHFCQLVADWMKEGL